MAPRGPTSRTELMIGWHYPVPPAAPAPRAERTAAEPAARALPLGQAYASIAGEDYRPLLVLRECLVCTGTDDALLTRQADNEKTFLLSRWFRCVKLPPDVSEPDHPFHALFAGDDPSHLFVARSDGGGRLDLNGSQSRTELWSSMQTLLASEYVEEPDGRLKELMKLLDSFDKLDEEIGRLEDRLERTVEDKGPASSKVTKIRAKLEQAQEERAEALEMAARITKLALKAPPEEGGPQQESP